MFCGREGFSTPEYSLVCRSSKTRWTMAHPSGWDLDATPSSDLLDRHSWPLCRDRLGHPVRPKDLRDCAELICRYPAASAGDGTVRGALADILQQFFAMRDCTDAERLVAIANAVRKYDGVTDDESYSEDPDKQPFHIKHRQELNKARRMWNHYFHDERRMPAKPPDAKRPRSQ